MTNEELADRLHSAAIHLLRRVRKEDDASGLTAPKLSVLPGLGFGGGPRTVGALATAEQVTPPTMSVLVAELERAGLVVRRRGDDARQVVVEPTDEARRLLIEGRKRRTAWLTERLWERSADELAALATAAGVLEDLVR